MSRTGFDQFWKKRPVDVSAPKRSARFWFELGRKTGESELQKARSKKNQTLVIQIGKPRLAEELTIAEANECRAV